MSPRMRLFHLSIVSLSVLVLMTSALTAVALDHPKNGTFESAGAGGPADWHPQTWAGEPKFTVETGHSGVGVAVSGEKGVDAAWQTNVPVLPYSTYRLSGRIKTENVKPENGREPS